MTDPYEPRPEHRFTFGLWTVGNTGRDPFGHEVRPPLDPAEAVHRLADLGAYGVNFHDNDLVPAGTPAAEREAIVKRFRRALDETGMHVPMATTNLFSRPIFKEGAFTANDPDVRRFAVAKTLDAIELGVELGAEIYVLWGGREGSEADAAKPVGAALDRYKEALDLLCAFVQERGYAIRLPSSPSPTSRAATCCCRRWVTRWRSSTGWSTPRWWASTRSSPTRRCRGCRSTREWPRRCGRGSCSTSTSTPRSPASSTRTSASAAKG